jgi:hypothetical protein
MNSYVKLSLAEWAKTYKNAVDLWSSTELGKRPNTVPDSIKVRVTIIEVVALSLLAFIIVFTGFKAVLHAVPVADSMYTKLLAGEASNLPLMPSRELFISAMQVMFFIASELGLVYFMLMAKDIKHVAVSHWRDYFSIVTIARYLPTLAVWGIILFVVQISANEGGSVLDNYLPIVMGMALATFVEDFLEKRAVVSREYNARLSTLRDAWDKRKASMAQDEQFLLFLSGTIWESLLGLTRKDITNNNKPKRVNASLETLGANERQAIILNEYKRNTTNLMFAKEVWRENQKYTEDVQEALLENATVTATIVEGGKRLPPNGLKQWTWDALVADLSAWNAPKPYTEKLLQEHYQAGYGVRSVFRKNKPK